jgi:hypothetical protein
MLNKENKSRKTNRKNSGHIKRRRKSPRIGSIKEVAVLTAALTATLTATYTVRRNALTRRQLLRLRVSSLLILAVRLITGFWFAFGHDVWG